MKKLLALSIAILLIFSLLISCKKQDDDENKGSVSTVSGEGDENQEDIPALHTLPKYDFEGKTFTIFTREEFKYEFTNESDTSSPIGEFVFNRNSAVQDYYKINLNILTAPGAWSARAEYKQKINNAVMGGDACEYDIICGAQNQINQYVTEGFFLNLRGIDTINFDNKWYFEGFVKNITVNDRLYFAVGDAAPTLLENMNIVVFNKDICLSNNIAMPYDLVRADNWTLETMEIMADQYPYADVNNDTKFDQDDQYSIVGGGAMLRGLGTSFKMDIVSMDEMGYPELTLYNDRNVEIFDEFQKFLHNGSGGNFRDGFDPAVNFGNNKSLLQFITPSGIINLRKTYDVNYGIVPYPKYNSEQEESYTHIYETLSVFAIPKNAADAENSGIVLEALGAASYDHITPKYFETVLRMQNSQDSDSLEMMTIARKNICFNFGAVHSKAIGDIDAILDGMKNGDYNLTSSWQKRGERWNTALGTLIEGYIGLE